MRNHIQLNDYMKILNIQLINMNTNFKNENFKIPDEIEVRFNIGLDESINVYNETNADINFIVEIEIYKKDDESYKEENLSLSMFFVHKITLESTKLIQIEEIDKKDLIKICSNYLYPSLRELVNIICYKMNIFPLDIPNFASFTEQ